MCNERKGKRKKVWEKNKITNVDYKFSSKLLQARGRVMLYPLNVL